MGAILIDWVGLFIRWIHVMVGIAWIGTSFHFIWLDASLRKAARRGRRRRTWMVHGGGFYHAQKYLVAPETLPKELHWFKYEAYFTWVSGFLLLAVVYYLNAERLPHRPGGARPVAGHGDRDQHRSLAAGWLLYDAICRSPLGRDTVPLALAVFILAVAAAIGFTHVFSGRAAFVHVGAFLGTIMAANVFFIIIPNQKKVVAALIAGRSPDPRARPARQAALAAQQLPDPAGGADDDQQPLSDPLCPGRQLGLCRRGAGAGRAGAPLHQFEGPWHHRLVAQLGPPASAALFAVVMIVSTMNFSSPSLPADAPPVTMAQLQPIFQQRCQACHSAHPSDPGYRAPPKGIAFDTADEIQRYAPVIYRMAVLTRAMPLSNKTGMTPEERMLIGRWIDEGAKK